MKFALKLVAGVALGLAASNTFAAPLAVEDFEKDNVGQISGQSGGNGWSAAWYSNLADNAVVGPSGLNYSSGSVFSSGGTQDLQISGNSDSAADRYLVGPTNITTPIYFSFLLSANNVANNEFFQVGLSNNASGNGTEPALSVGVTSNGSPGNTLVFFARSPNGSANGVNSSTPFAANQTYLLVGEVSSTSGTTYNKLDLYVNPSSGTQPATPTVENTNNSGLGSISSFNVRTARFVAGDVYSIDNVLIGTNYSDVVSTPEPASLGLFAIACGSLLVRRRRTVK